MIYFLAYIALVAASDVMAVRGMLRPQAIIALPLLALDCFLNMALCWQSWRNTMSGEAWHHRDHPYFGWCHKAIDALFFWQVEHCRHQAEKEARYGGFWPAWWAQARYGMV